MDVLLQYIPKQDGPDELKPKFLYWKETKGHFRIGYPAEFTLDQAEAQHLKMSLNRASPSLKEARMGASFFLDSMVENLI
jgi:hypothetical protein